MATCTARGVVETCDWVRVENDTIVEIRSFYDSALIREILSPAEQERLDASYWRRRAGSGSPAVRMARSRRGLRPATESSMHVSFNRFPCVLFAFGAALQAFPLSAQQPRSGVTVALALATRYPERFQNGCTRSIAAAPSIRVHHRLHRFVLAEAGIAGLLRIPPGSTSACADAIPLMDGDVYRRFDSATGSVSLAGEARLVATPVTDDRRAWRVIGGGAWYPTRASIAWLLGAGYRTRTSWGALVLDLERWNVGVPYDLVRFRSGGAPSEPLGDGREWQRLWQVRVGFTVLSR